MSYVSTDDVQERLGDQLYVELTDDEGSHCSPQYTPV